MNISKRLLWLKPYLQFACQEYNIKKPISIRAFTPRWDKTQDSLASVAKTTKNNYRISIQLYYKENNGDLIVLPELMVLDSLAHELAHIKNWSHNSEWKKLYKQMYKDFKGLYRKSKHGSLVHA